MSGGLIGAGQYYRQSASQSFGGLAQAEAQREQTNQQIDQAEKQSTLGLVGTGAAIGGSVAGPYGAFAGAAIGLLAGPAF